MKKCFGFVVTTSKFKWKMFPLNYFGCTSIHLKFTIFLLSVFRKGIRRSRAPGGQFNAVDSGLEEQTPVRGAARANHAVSTSRSCCQ